MTASSAAVSKHIKKINLQWSGLNKKPLKVKIDLPYGSWREKNKHGYSNLVSYVLSSHTNQNEANVSLYNYKAGKLYAWLRFIILSVMPFSAVSNNHIHPF